MCIECAAQMLARFGSGAAAQRLSSGALVMWDRTQLLVAAFEMLCQLRRNRVEPFAPRGFEPAADACVARRAPHRRQAVGVINGPCRRSRNLTFP
jgi:hypothetical protein